VPAAAVIPSLLAYVKFVAFKKLVVEPIWFIDLSVAICQCMLI